MDIRKRYIAESRRRMLGPDELEFDFENFIYSLLLYDTYILDSTRLLEFPPLVRAFGVGGVIELLNSGALKIHCDTFQVTNVGQSDFFDGGRRYLPPLQFAFRRIAFNSEQHSEYIASALNGLAKIGGLNTSQVRSLKTAVTDQLVQRQTELPGKKSLGQFLRDVEGNVPVAKQSVAQVVEVQLGAEASQHDFDLHLHPMGDGDFRAETDLGGKYGLSNMQVHHIIERGLLRMSVIHERLELMETHTALPGFHPAELPLYEGRLSFLVQQVAPERQFERLKRVLTIQDFPDLGLLAQTRNLRLQDLLEIRASNTCAEFRDWLASIDSTSDDEVRIQVGNLRQQIARFAHSIPGKALRILTAAGLGLVQPAVAGLAIGTLASGLDTFLLEKVLPVSGPLAFINNRLPSLLEKYRKEPITRIPWPH